MRREDAKYVWGQTGIWFFSHILVSLIPYAIEFIPKLLIGNQLTFWTPQVPVATVILCFVTLFDIFGLLIKDKAMKRNSKIWLGIFAAGVGIVIVLSILLLKVPSNGGKLLWLLLNFVLIALVVLISLLIHLRSSKVDVEQERELEHLERKIAKLEKAAT